MVRKRSDGLMAEAQDSHFRLIPSRETAAAAVFWGINVQYRTYR